MKLLRILSIVFCMLALTSRASAQTLRIAAASDLQFVMRELADRFEKKTGTTVDLIYGSSGNFRAQIENGAPFDIFLSADELYPQQLVTDGLADAQSLVIYAQGHLVLWAPAGANLRISQRGFSALEDSRVAIIAIASPEHAPYGRAAVAALRKAGLYDQLKAKLVYGENISQAAQFAQSGSAQVGILALSLTFAKSMEDGDKWEIPTQFYPAIKQAAVIIKNSPNKPMANAFLAFIKGEEGRTLLSRYGLTPPSSPEKTE